MSLFSKLSHQELLLLAKRSCVPPLLPNFHKGQNGRVCIIGGCEDYTGAPYFSAHSAALFGVDLTHVMCELNAAPVIKSYSPNLMVHPYLRESGSASMDKICALLDRMHVCVVGPGLGRNTSMLETTIQILEYLVQKHEGAIPVVLDADGLFLVSSDPYSKKVCNLLRRFQPGRVVLTPNVVEFGRITKRLGCKTGADVARELQCIVVQKGTHDTIWHREGSLKCASEGSNKRVGGQGDTLTGAIAAMLAFSRATHDFEIWKPPQKLEWEQMVVLSCYVGCATTRECARLAYASAKRAMQTTDLNNQVGRAYTNLLGDPENDRDDESRL
ncbi:LAMI_0D02938g1_1 [Lachancea mirantina]|uniref:ATP-dependent (S)-NAD(P)H-hydrate dehydratase n=1 Tax=Lachancea mirantina TaxID=1230905 RepID=A0A1G4J9N1_9SACH|nr:LAMI_0D02938g1_1 [Lachancea mirantina]